MNRIALRLRHALVLLALALPAVSAVRPADGAEEDVPLPLTGKITVKANGKRYVVDGRQVIPAGSMIKLEEAVHVVGRNGARLEVKGGLRALGGDDGKVVLEGIDFSSTVAPENGFHLNSVEVNNCTFAHADGTAFAGEVTIENVRWGGPLDLRIKRGFVRIMSASVGSVSVTCVADKGKAPEVAFRNGKIGSLVLRGACAATVRSVEVGSLEATDFTDLVVDNCDVTGSLTFIQPAEGSFSRLVLSKCNMIQGATLTLRRPAGPKGISDVEKVRVDKFWFGRTDGKADVDDKAIAARIQDGADDPEVTVRAFWQNPQDRRR